MASWNTTTGYSMRQVGLPFSGRSATARSCSMRAAADAARTRGQKSERVLRLLAEAGARGLTRHDIESVSGYRTSSLCSILDALVTAGLVCEQGSRISGPFRKCCTVYVRATRAEGVVA